MSNVITVGISDLAVATPPDTLVTFALGSCVGICLYDDVAKVAGLSHVLLPSSALSNDPTQIMRFADTAPHLLVQKMTMKGASLKNIKAKIAGGATMFASMNLPFGNIGERNVTAVKEALGKLRIPILANDTGANYGRTLYFDAETFTMHIKSATKGEFKF